MSRALLVTHHAPDLDAVGAVWLFTRFDQQDYADAQFAFVNPGAKLSEAEAEKHGFALHEVTHVDTGLGEFDHHQPEFGGDHSVCASSRVLEHLTAKYPQLKDNKALQAVVAFITQIDHFGEIHWPESCEDRSVFMIQELLSGFESFPNRTDESQLQFGMQCLDAAYASMVSFKKAEEILVSKGTVFLVQDTKCLGIETRNDAVIKLAQKKGFALVIRKDPESGIARIKVRPDCLISLRKVADRILEKDTTGSWYYHPSDKMFINGSAKQDSAQPTPLSLSELIELVKKGLADE